jgi:phosphatidylglycerophosphate synthase
MTTLAGSAAIPRAADGRTARIARLIDPSNRFYRYPLARRLVRRIAPTPVMPNQVTAAHTLLGLAAAACLLHGSGGAVLGAGLCWELHLVLDCVDGELARVRGTTSDRGRFLDILGDTIAYVALAAAMAVHVGRVAPHLPAATIAVALIASGALAAWAHDFYLRKLTAALTTGTDPVYAQLHAKHRAIRSGTGGFVTWFGYVFEWLQIIGLQPASRRDLAARLRADTPPAAPGTSAEVAHIVRHADTPAGRRAFRAVSLMSNDNDVTLVGLGLLTGHVVAGQVAAIVFAGVTLVVGIGLCRAFLRTETR